MQRTGGSPANPYDFPPPHTHTSGTIEEGQGHKRIENSGKLPVPNARYKIQTQTNIKNAGKILQFHF